MKKDKLWNPFNCEHLSKTRGCMSPNKCGYSEECCQNWEIHQKKLNRYNAVGMDLDFDKVRMRKNYDGDFIILSELKEIVEGIPHMNIVGSGDESQDGIHSFRYCNGWNDCLRFVKKVLNI